MYIQILTSLSEELLRLLIGTVPDVLYQLIRDEPLDGLHHTSKTGDMILHPSWSSREWDFGRRMARIPRRLDCEHSSEVALINYELFILQTHITLIADITITVIVFLRLIWISFVIRRSYTFRLSSYRL